jgi:cyclophilin family peptidyl-prolyl cis-trans isomerase
MRRFALVGLVLLGGILMHGTDAALAAAKASKTKEAAAAKTGEDVAVIKTNLGTIVFRFFEKDAPNHVDNFKKIANSHFYDGTLFHRVIPGFMIQGGDPNTKGPQREIYGQGNGPRTLKAEFNANKHLRGTVSMARAQDPNSASCQFFICVAPQAFLDGHYTVFGQVVEGMDVVDKIVSVKRDERDDPIDPVRMESVTIEKRKL